VERLGTAHLADDDAFRTHTQTVAYEVTHLHLALAFQVWRTRFEAHDVRLLELQFGGVFAGNDALVVINVARETIEKRRLAGTGAAGNQRIHPAAADDFQEIGTMLGNRAVFHELLERELVLAEFANGERRAVDRKRRHDDVDARAVRQARVADRAR